MKPTPNDLVEIGICNRIINEPNGGAHRDFNASANELKIALQEELNELSIINPDDFLDNRIEKYDKLGYFQESI